MCRAEIIDENLNSRRSAANWEPAAGAAGASDFLILPQAPHKKKTAHMQARARTRCSARLTLKTTTHITHCTPPIDDRLM